MGTVLDSVASACECRDGGRRVARKSELMLGGGEMVVWSAHGGTGGPPTTENAMQGGGGRGKGGDAWAGRVRMRVKQRRVREGE